MILINLLPHREAARKRRREAFFATLVIAALVGVLMGGAVYSWYQAQTSSQRGTNSTLRTEITRLEGQIKEIAGLEQEIAALRARQNAVEDLQGNRNLPVYLLEDLVKQLPDGVYITTMKQEGQVVSLSGVAQSNERVSELLRNFGHNSLWFTRPELIEITSSNLVLSQRDQRRVSNFSMRVGLKRASDQAKTPASGASSPGVSPPSAVSPPAVSVTAPALTSSQPATVVPKV